MVSEHSPESQVFEYLLQLIKSERFLKNIGTGNEVPFYICPYLPKHETSMKKIILQLRNHLQTSGVSVLHLDLFDLVLELLKNRGVFERIVEKETEMAKQKLLEMLQNICDSKEHLIPLIAKKMDESQFDVLFLTGVGEVFPYIRSHNVLNNLQSTAREKPTVLFFPGSYTHTDSTGASLNLFNRLHDDKYYRAFNIFTFGH